MKTKTEVSKRERERYEREREAVEDDSFIAPWFLCFYYAPNKALEAWDGFIVDDWLPVSPRLCV